MPNVLSNRLRFQHLRKAIKVIRLDKPSSGDIRADILNLSKRFLDSMKLVNISPV